MDLNLLLSILAGIALLLILILRFKLQAFIALLIASILVGGLAGMNPGEIMETVKEGMGSTLGFVAVVVGLGAMFGAILEQSGGAESLAKFLLRIFGEKRSSTALSITGFIVAIPVFFDVGFIILVPLIYSLQRKTGKSLLLYAFPLLAGLGVTHAFIPPTPGPVAVADIISADLGWVILIGALVGIPTVWLSGPVLSKFLARRMHIEAPEAINVSDKEIEEPPIFLTLAIIAIPILLIVLNSLVNSPIFSSGSGFFVTIINWIGHPFTALIIANLLAWILLGLKRGFSSAQLLKITTASMGPAGIIILLTGAGGVFKQVLIDTGGGKMIAEYLSNAGLPVILFAFLAAAAIRIIQGSATVAMITAAGLIAPLMIADYSNIEKALIATSIASGACILSHVNDSGFWLVSKYLGLDEAQTLKSWTVVTTVIALTGFLISSLIWLLI